MRSVGAGQSAGGVDIVAKAVYAGNIAVESGAGLKPSGWNDMLVHHRAMNRIELIRLVVLVDCAHGNQRYTQRAPSGPVVDFQIDVELFQFNFTVKASTIRVIHGTMFYLDFCEKVGPVAQLVAGNQNESVRIKLVGSLLVDPFHLAIKI